MIGYILLITIAIIMSIVVYQWLKTYVPRGEVECPPETSFYVKDYVCGGDELIITLQNNGRFEIGGYYIKATDSEEQEIATIDISGDLIEGHAETVGQEVGARSVAERIFFFDTSETGGSGNILDVGDKTINVFHIRDTIETIYKLELTPLRFQKVGETTPAVACSTSRIEYDLTC